MPKVSGPVPKVPSRDWRDVLDRALCCGAKADADPRMAKAEMTVDFMVNLMYWKETKF